MNKELKQFENSIEAFKDYFLKRYFEEEPTDLWWVGDMIGGVLCSNDYFFDVDEMIDFVRYDYSIDDMFNYKDYALDIAMKADINEKMENKSRTICIRDWRQLKKKDTKRKKVKLYRAYPIAADIPVALEKGGFKTQEEAWDYIKDAYLCDMCLQDLEENGIKKDETLLSYYSVSQTRCGMEWEVEEYEV